jgi:hypothetical protein
MNRRMHSLLFGGAQYPTGYYGNFNPTLAHSVSGGAGRISRATRPISARWAGPVLDGSRDPGCISLGNLDYGYDIDDRFAFEGGILASIILPGSVSSASYTSTNQVSNWNQYADQLRRSQQFEIRPSL